MKIIPIDLSEANAFVLLHSDVCEIVTVCKFCLGVQNDEGKLCGISICGNAISCVYDIGYNFEIVSVCTDGDNEVCKMLYNSCVQIARTMGYHKVITFTKKSESENEEGLKETGFICHGGSAIKDVWTVPRNGERGIPEVIREMWIYDFEKEK